MKRIFDIDRNVFAAVCYGLCGAVWLYRGFLKEPRVNRFYVALGVMWLTGTVIWIVRAVRERRKEQQVPKAPPGEES